MDEADYIHLLWACLLPYYLMTIAVETPILLIGLSPRHSLGRRIFCGIWLTACTYPIVFLVLAPLLQGRSLDNPPRPDEFVWEGRAIYLLVAETFAPAAECALFWAAFGTRKEWCRRSMWRDFAAIILANLASFGAGEWFSKST